MTLGGAFSSGSDAAGGGVAAGATSLRAFTLDGADSGATEAAGELACVCDSGGRGTDSFDRDDDGGPAEARAGSEEARAVSASARAGRVAASRVVDDGGVRVPLARCSFDDGVVTFGEAGGAGVSSTISGTGS